MHNQRHPSGLAIAPKKQKRNITMADLDVECFLADLEIARRVYRGAPHLVTSPEFPEPWKAHYVSLLGDEPDDTEGEEVPTA